MKAYQTVNSLYFFEEKDNIRKKILNLQMGKVV